jgi:hypothetical protein
MDDRRENLLVLQDMQSAQKHSRTVKDALVEEAATLQKSYETFYNNLALFSGGTIALSVTYLGYLKSNGAAVAHLAILIARWACLLATVALGLFYSFLYSPLPLPRQDA